MKNIYKWDFILFQTNESNIKLPIDSKFREYNYSVLAWNNTYEYFFKLSIFFVLYGIFSFILSRRKKVYPKEKLKQEQYDLEEKESLIYKFKLKTFQLLHVSSISYILVIWVALLINFTFTSFNNFLHIQSYYLNFSYLNDIQNDFSCIHYKL